VVLRGRKGKGKVLVSDDFGGDDGVGMLEENGQEPPYLGLLGKLERGGGLKLDGI